MKSEADKLNRIVALLLCVHKLALYQWLCLVLDETHYVFSDKSVMYSFNQAPVPTLGHSLINLRQELKIMIESCTPLETQTTHLFISI